MDIEYKYRIDLHYYNNWPDQLMKFLYHCIHIAAPGEGVDSVACRLLSPTGRIVLKDRGSYIEWVDESYHALFVLRWS